MFGFSQIHSRLYRIRPLWVPALLHLNSSRVLPWIYVLLHPYWLSIFCLINIVTKTLVDLSSITTERMTVRDGETERLRETVKQRRRMCVADFICVSINSQNVPSAVSGNDQIRCSCESDKNDYRQLSRFFESVAKRWP